MLHKSPRGERGVIGGERGKQRQNGAVFVHNAYAWAVARVASENLAWVSESRPRNWRTKVEKNACGREKISFQRDSTDGIQKVAREDPSPWWCNACSSGVPGDRTVVERLSHVATLTELSAL
jgi:hypothetical protein